MATCPTCRKQYPPTAERCADDGAVLLPDEIVQGLESDLPEGSAVGEYRIEGKIGEGGFASVYKAAHPLIGKRVAVKVLNRQFSSNPQMVERFIAEAREVNRIRHRNIIDIFSFGVLPDGRQYFVMELLHGMGLDRYLVEKGRLPVEEALPILRSISRALDAAHAAGIAHRDMKPENVFLCMDPEEPPFPKILDFGIAKLLSGEQSGTSKTKTGAIMGTPFYMSPEQCRGIQVDHRTDIYAFGVIAFQLLSGRVPFDGDNVMDVLMQHMTALPPRLSALMPDIPSAVDDAIARMLMKDAAERPQTVAAAMESLTKAFSASAPPVSVNMPPSSLRTGGPVSGALAAPAQTAATASGKTFAGAERDVTAAPRRSLGVPIAIVAVMLLSLGGAAALFLRKKEPRLLAAEPPAAASASAIPSSAPAEVRATTGAVTAPADVSVTIPSKPEGALVFKGEERVGKTPGPFRLGRGSESVKLTVKADGYAPASVSVTPADDVVLPPIELKKIKKAGAGVPREIESPF